MKIATFNINGVRARLPRLIDWIGERQPDVAMLQEIKCQDEVFPREAFEDLGYSVVTHGQKGFNGVAILSKYPLEDVSCGLPGDDYDQQARWIEATIILKCAIRICCLYLPNGNPVGTEKYSYKLAWMERMIKRLKDILSHEEPAVIAGDYNVIPQCIDAHNPENWRNDALFMPETRALWQKMLYLGYTDALRVTNGAAEQYTFWDFKAGAWQRNNGIRIDHILLTPQCADLLLDCQIDKHIRGKEKPSDHVPIWIKLNI